MNPKVTVLMPVYNAEKFLPEAIKSVLAQTYTDFELLIINDGSTDRSREIILSFCDPRIRLIDNEKNMRLVFSLNKGLQLAKGKYIARQDADDIASPKRLKKQIEYLEKNPQIVLLGSWAEIIDERGKLISVWKRPTGHCSIVWRLLFNNCLVHSSVMFPRDNVLKVGGYNSSTVYGQDYDLWVRLSKVGKIKQLPEVLLKHRVSSESISVKHSKEQSVTREQVAFNYVKSMLPKIDYHDLTHFLKRTKSNDLEYRQIKEIVGLTKNIRDKFFEINNPDSVYKKEINQDILNWFLMWAMKNWRRPVVCLYLIVSAMSMRVI